MSYCDRDRDRLPPMHSSSSTSSSSKRHRGNSDIDDLRKEFDEIVNETNATLASANIKPEDLTWEKYGAQVQDFLVKKANEPKSDDAPRVQTQKFRRWNPHDKPLFINGTLVPRKDALLIEMVLNNKSSLKAQLELTKQPIVGLDYLIEHIDPEGDNPRIYYCTLCNQFNSTTTIMFHLTGYCHRVRYIGKGYPNQAKTYLLPDGRRVNRNTALMKMAQARCQELELVYGRGEYQIKHERPSIPEGKLDCDENDVIINEGETLQALKSAHKVIRKCKLQTDEDVRLAKQIINDLTEAIIAYKQLSAEQKFNQGISNLLQQGRQQVASISGRD